MRTTWRPLISLFLIGIAPACTKRADVDTVALGTTVEVTRQDGGVVRGALTARDAKTVQVAVGSGERSIPRTQISSVELVRGTVDPPLPVAAKFREFTIPGGTTLSARLGTSLGSDTSHVEDPVGAVLTTAVLVNGVEILPEGSVLTGVITTAEPSGKTRGRASLAMTFQSISVGATGERYPMSASVHRTAASGTGDDATKIGIPAAGGAVLGAILGGKKGAGIGAAIGGGAGTAVVLTTAGTEIHMASGAALSVVLDRAVDVQVPIKR